MCKYVTNRVVNITTEVQYELINKLLSSKPKYKPNNKYIEPSFDKRFWTTKKN